MSGKKKSKSVCDFIGLKNNKLHYKCKEYEKGQLKPINRFIKKFPSIYQFYNEDINNLLLLRKSFYPYEYKDSWIRFVETSLSDKKKPFYSKLQQEDINDKDYGHAQKVFEENNLKNLGDYHDLYVQGDTLLLADNFENFRNKCTEVYKLDPAHFLSAPRLAWQAC